MAFSTAFERAGKYAGLSGFPTDFRLGEDLTTPLRQQPSSASSSSLPPWSGSFNPVDYYKSTEGLPDNVREALIFQEINNRSSSKIGEDDTLLKIFNIANDPSNSLQINWLMTKSR